MGFRHTDLGRHVSEQPAEAAKQLVTLLVEHGGNQSTAAKAVPVDYRTFTRWLARLAEAGHDVKGQAFDIIEAKREQAEKDGAPPPPPPPKAGRKPR